MLKLWLIEGQFKYEFVTIIFAVAIELPEFVATNGRIFPTPELDKPMLELLFTQFMLEPFEGKLKLINDVVCPLQ
jgi:hypothetical protein